VFSADADAMQLCVFDGDDPNVLLQGVAMRRDENGVWSAESEHLSPGKRYALRVSGPKGARHVFNPHSLLFDPYARGLVRNHAGDWLGAVVDDDFDWGDAHKPNTPLEKTVLYEAHLKGLSKLNPAVPAHLRGTYAGLAHESTLGYLRDLGVTAVELLPVHAFVSEKRLVSQGLTNYWGYNTLAFFAPHPPYASAAARAAGPEAVLREFKGMVKLLHEAGLEVILDVVYNHTAEEERHGPVTSLRGIDNSTYYRQDATGRYIDTTGCGNALDFANPVPQRLVLDSLRYWATEVRVDGFRFDLATTLGRDANGRFDPKHPLLAAILGDPQLANVKRIAEPWDVGDDGWQTGNFPDGFSEWNDHYRDQVRSFWLDDVAVARATGSAPNGIGPLATHLAGSSDTFSPSRVPLASVNFITAHDGFTMADLAEYDVKHNLGNGESNNDGTDGNRSFNHGVEGPTADEPVLLARRKAVRNLLATLLLSAGVPMITAGDEFGRSQRGNNNAYCHDNELSWMSWLLSRERQELLRTTRRLLELRRQNPALRPGRYAKADTEVANASRMSWYCSAGRAMNDGEWDSALTRTVQWLVTSTPQDEPANSVLLIVHGVESDVTVTLPRHPRVESYTLLWDSTTEVPIPEAETPCRPGASVLVGGTSMQLYRANVCC
jgi:glycogen operon protein